MFAILVVASSALQLPTPLTQGAGSAGVATRRGVMGGAVAAAAAAAAIAAPPRAFAEDKVVKVPATKIGITPGGVKYFTKEAGSCSPFNPCVPQAGDIVKIKYKAYLSNVRGLAVASPRPRRGCCCWC